MNYRIIAISKNNNGGIQFAIIETNTGYVQAVVSATDGSVYKVDLVNAFTPTEIKWLTQFIEAEQSKGRFNS